jgi:hypothetical protein
VPPYTFTPRFAHPHYIRWLVCKTMHIQSCKVSWFVEGFFIYVILYRYGLLKKRKSANQCCNVSYFVWQCKVFRETLSFPRFDVLLPVGSTLRVKGKGKAIPLQALSVPGGWGSHISRNSAHEGGKVSPTHWPPLPHQEIFLVLISVKRLSQPQGLSAAGRIMSIPMTSSGIEPQSSRLVAQCLNQMRHHVPVVRVVFGFWLQIKSFIFLVLIHVLK